MRITSRTLSTAVLVAVCIAANPVPAGGQSVWLLPRDEPSLSLEALKSDFWKPWVGDEPKFSSSVWFLSTRIPASDYVTVLAELPFTHYDNEDLSGAENMIGNPYLGLEIHIADAAFYSQFGIRLALAPEDKPAAASYGGATDYDRFEAFAPDLVTFNCRLGYRIRKWPSVVIHSYIGPSFFIPTEGGGDGDVFIDYGAQLWVHSRVARIGSGFTGRLYATAERGNLWEITVHQFGFAANFGSGRFRPGVHLRVPLDDNWSSVIRYFYGINLTVRLGPCK